MTARPTHFKPHTAITGNDNERPGEQLQWGLPSLASPIAEAWQNQCPGPGLCEAPPSHPCPEACRCADALSRYAFYWRLASVLLAPCQPRCGRLSPWVAWARPAVATGPGRRSRRAPGPRKDPGAEARGLCHVAQRYARIRQIAYHRPPAGSAPADRDSTLMLKMLTSPPDTRPTPGNGRTRTAPPPRRLLETPAGMTALPRAGAARARRRHRLIGLGQRPQSAAVLRQPQPTANNAP